MKKILKEKISKFFRVYKNFPSFFRWKILSKRKERKKKEKERKERKKGKEGKEIKKIERKITKVK